MLTSKAIFLWISYQKKKYGVPSHNFVKKNVLCKKGDEITRFDGTVRPDWICMRVVSLDGALKSHQPLKFLDFFNFSNEFLTVCMCTNRNLFRWTVLQKCRKVNNCFLHYGPFIFQHPAIQNKIVQPLGGFFQQISAPANRKKEFYTNRLCVGNISCLFLAASICRLSVT